MAVPPGDSTTFVLALTRLDGVGRVTARRLADRFTDLGDLRGHSREQVYLRIKGVPNAEKIAESLFDDAFVQPAFDQATAEIDALSERGVQLLSDRSEAWPARLRTLAPADRPLLLWAYGQAPVLQQPTAALLARPPMDEAPFERAQALAQHLTAAGVVPVLAAQGGFDIALTKRALADGAPVVLVAGCGLARMPKRLRPVASQAVRAGGLLLSPFAMQHGPFDHDESERARLQAALGHACVFAPAAAETPEARAQSWALEAERPVFTLGDDASDGQAVRGPGDFGHVLDAVRE